MNQHIEIEFKNLLSEKEFRQPDRILSCRGIEL